jgi:methionine sulfoxide reductase heme-binding subunit
MRPEPAEYSWWLASRASGVLALVLVTVSVGIGLTMASKLVRKRGVGPILARVHEHTALVGLVAIAVHMITLLGDPWLNPGIKGLLIPFQMKYQPVFTGLGIIAAYLAAFLGLTFYVRRRIGPKLWRKAHRATVLVWALGLVHTIGAGTDAGAVWLREFMVLTGVPIVALFAVRTFRKPAAKTGSQVAGRGSQAGTASEPRNHTSHRPHSHRPTTEGAPA